MDIGLNVAIILWPLSKPLHRIQVFELTRSFLTEAHLFAGGFALATWRSMGSCSYSKVWWSTLELGRTYRPTY